jgi:hypothetical protein
LEARRRVALLLPRGLKVAVGESVRVGAVVPVAAQPFVAADALFGSRLGRRVLGEGSPDTEDQEGQAGHGGEDVSAASVVHLRSGSPFVRRYGSPNDL